MVTETVVHPFKPVYNENSKIIVLGTIPSVKSREENFYYGNPRNRFWKVLSCLTGHPLPLTVRDKKELLLDGGIALWDVLKSCDIDQSKDSSIINPVPNDFSGIINRTGIKAVFTNGKKAQELYRKLCYPRTNLKSRCLPSTSPANGGYSLERLLSEWSVLLKYI